MAVVKYACEICGKIWDTEEEAATCQGTHKSVVSVKECKFKKKAEPDKYPHSIVCEMSDGEDITYYIARAEKQPADPIEYKPQERHPCAPSVRYPQ